MRAIRSAIEAMGGQAVQLFDVAGQFIWPRVFLRIGRRRSGDAASN
jgi:hypothetical protein